MISARLWLLCLAVIQAFTTEAQPAELHAEVPENYGGNFPFYIIKLPLPLGRDKGQIVLSGDSSTDAQDPFAVDPESGFLVATKALDREEKAEYRLQVTLESEDGQVLWGPQPVTVHVKDENDQASGHQAIATVEISIVQSTWIPLGPVHLAENLQVAYPHNIAQVHWDGGDVHYQLQSQPAGPFNVDAEGRIHVTTELDREAQAEYLLQIRAQNSRGEDFAEALELQVVVMDENDNAPVCSPHDPAISIPELSPPGTEVITLSAEDMDAPGSPNSHVVYRLLSPEPEEGAEEKAFELDSTTGRVMLGTAPLHPGQDIPLQVLAVDLAGSEGGLSSTCEVVVTITDVNNHAPEFITSQIGPVSLPEDVKPGVLVATLTATDADLEPAFRFMDFAIEEGDPKGIFDLAWEPDSDHVQLRLRKNLSYEAAPLHKVVVVVRNVEELVGPAPGPGATATVTILVERVIPPLKLDKESYETSIPVSTPAGSLLLTIHLSEPTSRAHRFSLVNDSEGWLCIKEGSGEVHTARSLRGAKPGDTYTVLMEAQDTDEPGLSTSATIVVHFLKASPVPRLAVAPGPSRHLCTPRQDYGVVVSGASEDPDQANRHGPYSFALGPNPTVQRDWRLQPFNDSHAYLTLALHWVEPGEYMVPVVVHHDAQMWQLQVQVFVCRCNLDGQCMRKVGRMKGMPTKLSAVGVLLGTLAAIGFILILVFTHLALARKKDLDQPADSVPLKAAM
ncbi:cadherin-16 isoform X5 [Microtus ochrogaster]|uniref:Cadherin-16 isoform X5 n=1 Tax=Microtus ochrogaster TaxID=79684 RepID=A0ABM1TXY7_MICOH|nr:cadherin-16 isoform X5 [Microtus ochrogaster]